MYMSPETQKNPTQPSSQTTKEMMCTTLTVGYIIYSVVWDEGGVGFFCVWGLIYMASSFVADDPLARPSG